MVVQLVNSYSQCEISSDLSASFSQMVADVAHPPEEKNRKSRGTPLVKAANLRTSCTNIPDKIQSSISQVGISFFWMKK